MLRSNVEYEFLYRPGREMSDAERARFSEELISVASECFDEVPHYQALTGSKEDLDRAVLMLAYGEDGELLGFSSAIMLPVESVGHVLHLGLTCVRPRARGLGLTHKMTSRLVTYYLLRGNPFRSVWISNVACVISSLANVSLHFEKVIPGPSYKGAPSKEHIAIAKAVDENYRGPLAINEEAVFNPETFVFEGSVKGTAFQKSETDKRYFHRQRDLTEFYQNLLNFGRGDEALQIGKVSFASYPKYMLGRPVKMVKSKLTGLRQA